MHGELIRLKTRDNLELQGLLCEPSKKASKAIVNVHGWVGNFYENRFMDHISEEAFGKNIAFFTFNNRGAGIITEFMRNNKREKIGGSLELFEDCVFDLESAVDFLHERGYKEIILQGHSLACQKIVYYMHTKKDKRVKGLVLLAPVDDVEVVTGKLYNNSVSRYNKSLKTARKMNSEGRGSHPVPKWMQIYPCLSANMFIQISDPESASGHIFDYSGDLAELKSLTIPVLAVFGSIDDYQPNPADKLEIIKRINANKTILMQESNHWFAGHEDELAKNVVGWVTKI